MTIAAAALAGCVSDPPALPPGPLDVRIDVVQRDWHTDLCLAPRDLTGKAATLAAGSPAARFVCFGFGERHYMVEKDHSTLAMLGSLLPSRAVVLMTPLAGPPGAVMVADHGPVEVQTVRVSDAGASNLSAFIWRTIQVTPDGAPAVLGPANNPGSKFFAANGTYNAMATCNTWTASGLRAAGLPVSDAVIFADDLMPQVRRIARDQARTPGS